MGFLLVGLALLALKLAAIGPVAQWSWFWIGLPFALTVAWWAFSDKMGLTRMREMDKLEERKAERRAKSLEALGIDSRRERKLRKARDLARRTAAHNPEPPPPPPVKVSSLSEGAPPRQEPPKF